MSPHAHLLLAACLSLLAGAVADAALARQEGQKESRNPSQARPESPDPKPGEQPLARRPIAGATARPPTAKTPIADIVAYRGDRKSPIITSENLVSLRFDHVNYDAPVVARVNGEPIDQATFRNRLILGQGSPELDRHLTYMLTKRRIDAAVADGADPEQFLVSDAEVRKAYEDLKASIPSLMQGMKAEDWEKQVKDHVGIERYLEMMKINLSFAKIFLPSATTQGGLPAHTKELLKPEQAETLEQQYAKGQDLPFLFKDSFIREIKAKLLERATLVYFFEGGLQSGVFMTVDGEPVFTDELWTLMSGRVKHADQDLTLREAVISLAFDQDLRAKKSALSTREAQELFRQHESTFEGTFFPLSFVVTLKGFGSLHKYREYYARKCSFTKWLKDQDPGDAFENKLRAYYTDEPTKLFFEQGRADCSVLFLSAWDSEHDRPKEGGIKAAVERANQILDEYRKGANFNDLVKQYSDIPDKDHKGLLGAMTRYELRRALSETEYQIYAAGYSLAEEIFLGATTDDILGPVIRRVPEQALGVYLVRVNRYEHETAVSFETKKDQVEQDSIDTHFLAHAHRCCQAAKIELTTK